MNLRYHYTHFKILINICIKKSLEGKSGVEDDKASHRI